MRRVPRPRRPPVLDSERRQDVFALATLTSLITLLFLDVLLGFRSLFLRDLSHYHYPSKKLLRDILLGGELPQWNPWFSAGQPMAANPQHEIFYPPNWLILLPDFHFAFHFLIVVHLWIVAWGTYALLRSLRTRPVASFFGATAFALGGIVLSYLTLLPFLFAVAWLPWICLFATRFLRTGSWRDFSVAAVLYGLQLIVGEPTTILQTGLLLGTYALFTGRARWLRNVAFVGLLCIAALAVSAVQMIPAIDHAGDSVRVRGLAYSTTVSWSMPLVRVAEFFYPMFLGESSVNGRKVYWGYELYEGRGHSFLFSIYPGLMISVLAVAGVFARIRGWGYVAVISVTSLLLAFGDNAPLWRALFDLHIVSGLRYPEKFVLMAVFVGTVFGARVLDQILAGDVRARRAALGVAIVTTAIAAFCALITLTPWFEPWFRAIWTPPPISVPLMLTTARFGWLTAAGRGVLLLILLAAVVRMPRRIWIGGAAILTLLEIALLFSDIVPRVPSEFYTQAPEIEKRLPRERGPWRLFHHAALHSHRPEVEIYFVSGEDSFWVYRNALFPMMPAQYGIRMAMEGDYDESGLLPSRDFMLAAGELAAVRKDWLAVSAWMSNAWYGAVFISPDQAFPAANNDLRRIQPVSILRFEKAPRYHFARSVIPVRDRADFVRKLGADADYRTAAYVDGAEGFMPAPGRVVAVRETANTARLEVETAGRAFLIMSVTPHKYWRITIDGIEAPAVVTNIGYQGVVVPAAGKHIVEMRYDNPLIRTGAAVTFAALLALLLITMRAL
jgi:hypothetical protein